MKVWIVTIGEPVPVGEGRRERLHRAGQMAHYLAEHGHQTTWWTSTFDHMRKEHWFPSDHSVVSSPALELRLLHGGGYRTNVSWARLRDHRRIADKFARLARQVEKPDVIVAALPTLELCTESVKYGQSHGVPVVLDMRDMWPDIFVDTVPKLLRPLARAALQPMFRSAHVACKHATALIGVTDAFVQWGLQRGRRERSSWDQSFPFGYATRPPSMEALRKAERFWDELGITTAQTPWVACFFGTFGRQLDVATVIDAARNLHERSIPIQFVLCGNGDRWEDIRRRAAGLPNVTLPGWVDAAAIHVLMRRSKVGLDPLPDRYDFLGHINNKAVEYFSAGLPVISSPDRGLLAELLSGQNAGRSYAHGNPRELNRILIDFYLDDPAQRVMSRNSRQLFQTRFDAEKVCSEMTHHLEHLVADRSPRTAHGRVSALNNAGLE